MEAYIQPLLDWLSSLATTVSLEVFVLVGAFLEEIIAPIPSPFVMTTAAVLAEVQGYSWLQMAFLVIIASLAKTASSYVLYFVVDKAEDVVVGKFGKYFGVSHGQIEKIGSFLTKSWWDDVLLFIARALPFVPTSLVTVAAGIIKYNVRSFLIMTFLGTVVRNIFYLWIAYFGWSYLHGIQETLLNNPILLVSVAVVVLIAVIAAFKLKDKAWDTVMSQKDSKNSSEKK